MPVSSDGIVTATLDAAWASVDVRINWNASGGTTPWRTTVQRTSSAKVAVVRSGDLVNSPGGVVHVYDHEAPLGVAATYQAFGYSAAGALVRTSTTTAVTPAAPAVEQLWLKAPENPSVSMLVTGDINWTRPRNTETFRVPGRPTPVVWDAGISSRQGTLGLITVTTGDRAKLRDLLTEPFALAQFAPAVGVADVFVSLGADPEDTVGPRQGATTRWPVDFVEVDRPATAGVPLRVPGWTNDGLPAAYATYTAFDAAFATYAAQSQGP